jgi:hypothetical protein
MGWKKVDIWDEATIGYVKKMVIGRMGKRNDRWASQILTFTLTKMIEHILEDIILNNIQYDFHRRNKNKDLYMSWLIANSPNISRPQYNWNFYRPYIIVDNYLWKRIHVVPHLRFKKRYYALFLREVYNHHHYESPPKIIKKPCTTATSIPTMSTS